MIRRLFCCVTLLACAYGTGQRVLQWHDNESLWASAVAVSPSKPRALNNLGGAYYAAEDYPGAAAVLRLAQQTARDPRRPLLQQEDDWLLATRNLALVLIQMRDWEGAREQIRAIQGVKPTFGPARPLMAFIE